MFADAGLKHGLGFGVLGLGLTLFSYDRSAALAGLPFMIVIITGTDNRGM